MVYLRLVPRRKDTAEGQCHKKVTKVKLVALGDFNAAISSNWYNKDINSNEGRKIEAVTSQNGLHQEINKPTYILNNSSSCIDLIFNSQPNLLIKSGVHPSLHPSCHHQMIFAKFNLDIVYPPPYEREI